MSKKQLNIGITGTGSLIGQAVIKSLKKSYLWDLYQIHLTGFDYITGTVGTHWCEKNFLLPDHFYKKDISEQTWLDAVTTKLKEEKIEILFIGIDFELPLFAKYRSFIEQETGTHVLVNSEEVVRIADDKYLTYSFLKENGLPHPLTFLPEEFSDNMLPYPFIIKPRIGARSVGVHVIRSYDEYLEKSKLVKNPLIQELVGNNQTEYTCGVICFEGILQDSIVLNRSLKEGNTFTASYSNDAPKVIYDYLADVCKHLKPHGACNFQLRLDDNGTPKIFEINARHSGTTYMRALLGFNEITCILEHMLGLPHRPFDVKEGTVVRFFDEFVA